jgi:hypothetical protein
MKKLQPREKALRVPQRAGKPAMLAAMIRSEKRPTTRYASALQVAVAALLSFGCAEATDGDEGESSGRRLADGGLAEPEPPRGPLEEPEAEGSGDDDDGPSGPPNDGDDDVTDPPDDPNAEPSPDNPEPTATATSPDKVTRVARLNHAQYQSTLRELLGIDDPPGDTFAPDALDGFDFDTTVDYAVDARLGPQYREAAEALATRAASEVEIFGYIVPCDTADAGCKAEFIAAFGQRAFRRPLSSDEQGRFEALFDQGAALVGSGDAFADGVELVVESMLQSPQFLYRTELSNELDAEGNIGLDDWEMASRLSYFLWNGMPDDELFQAAAEGTLTTTAGLRTQARRLLADERAIGKLLSFHEQAWQFGKLARIAPDRNEYPEVPEDLGSRAAEGGRLFVANVVTEGGGFTELLTAPYAFADDTLAPLYGQAVDGSFTRIELDPAERQGFLMQVGFLAANAHAVKTDPIHRGLFIVRNLLCKNVPDPDAAFTQMGLPETDTPPRTTREEVALLTGTNDDPDPMREAVCGVCHSLINPAGFAFENFDAVGQHRTTENDVEVDASGELIVDGEARIFSNGVELANLIASSAEGRACYATKLRSFAFGHDVAPDDPSFAQTVLELNGTLDLAEAIALSSSFRVRVPNEVAP